MGRFSAGLVAAALSVLVLACDGSAAPPVTAPSTSMPATFRTEPTSAPAATVTVVPAAVLAPTQPPNAATEPVATTSSVPTVQPARPVATQVGAVPQPTATTEAPARPPPVTVSMLLNLADRSFTPHQVHGNAGDTVALTFTGGTEQHTFTVSSLGIDVTIAARETKQFSFVMPVEGEVPFFCRFHGSATVGMHGLLIFH